MPRLQRGKESWEITQSGSQLEIRSNGKKSVRKFLTAEHAAAQLVKLIAEQQQAGFAEIISGARHPELERAIADAPDSIDDYRVYADWLESRGDPRGKLMALSLAGEPHDAAITKLIKAHEREFLGPLVKHRRAARKNDEAPFTWRYGFIHRAYINGVDHARPDQVLEDLVTHPSGALLVELFLVTPWEDGQRVIETLARVAPRSMRVLEVLQGRARLDFGAVWAVLPRLRRLSLRGEGFTLGEPQLRELEDLAIEDETFRSDTLAAVAQAPWPALRKLKLELGGLAEASLDDMVRVLERPDLAITDLAVRIFSHGRELSRALPDLPCARRLTRLDLSICRLTDADVSELVRRRSAFPALVELDVSANPLSKDSLAALAQIVPNVRAVAIDAARRSAGLPVEP